MRRAWNQLVMVFGLMVCGCGLVMAQTPVEAHWSGYDYPREIPAGINHHIIVEGDTLWDLSARYLGDPLLWPQLFQANTYIRDPDLIYPGDPIFLNVGVVVSDNTISKELSNEDEGSENSGEFSELEEFSEASEGENSEGSDGTELSQASVFGDGLDSEFVILPAGDRSDMECSTYLYETKSSNDVLPFDLVLAGGEQGTHSYSAGDIMYLNKGSADGVQAGEVYSIRRAVDKVYQPGSGKFLGRAIDQIGRIRVVATQEGNATGLIVQSCREILINDFLVPYEQEPIPLITELPVANRWDKFSTNGHGDIIWSEDRIAAFGKGHITNIDLGVENNVAPGDIFIIYRPNPNTDLGKKFDLPDVYLGHGVALKTSAQSSVMKVIEVFTNLKVGDKVVPLYQ